MAARGAFQVPTEAVGFEEGHHVVRHLRIALRLPGDTREMHGRYGSAWLEVGLGGGARGGARGRVRVGRGLG